MIVDINKISRIVDFANYINQISWDTTSQRFLKNYLEKYISENYTLSPNENLNIYTSQDLSSQDIILEGYSQLGNKIVTSKVVLKKYDIDRLKLKEYSNANILTLECSQWAYLDVLTEFNSLFCFDFNLYTHIEKFAQTLAKKFLELLNDAKREV